MSGGYSYSSELWPSLISLVLTIFLGVYSLQRRHVPGAKPFAFACLFGALWASGTALETASLDFSTQVFWIKFQTIWQLPSATAILCFVLEYAGLSRWLTRHNLILLAIPPLLTTLVVFTNDYHHLIWSDFLMAEHIIKIPGNANRFFVGYAIVIALANLLILVWLAIRSPQHRRPVSIMLLGQVTGRIFYMLNNFHINPLNPGESVFLVVGLVSSTYAIALFRFHVLDPIPLARSAIIDQMLEGALVLDKNRRIVDLNPAASRVLEQTASSLRGRKISDILPVDLKASRDNGSIIPTEISLGSGLSIRNYNLNIVKLVDSRNHLLGELFLLHEITELKRAHNQILEQQRVMATLQERERLARELHDSTGQVLSYVNLQSETIQKWLKAGNLEKAESLLTRLSEVAKEAHADIRESILSLKAGTPQGWSFLPALKKYLEDFKNNYGIHTELILENGPLESNFRPDAEVQILRVIQEAMTNARKHSNARNLRVSIEREINTGRIKIIDDGCGFDMDHMNRSGGHYGLAFMKERMMQIGGSIDFHSRPGEGTTITLIAPVRDQKEKRNESPAG
jgi:signal transduction histidine kinase